MKLYAPSRRQVVLRQFNLAPNVHLPKLVGPRRLNREAQEYAALRERSASCRFLREAALYTYINHLWTATAEWPLTTHS